MKQIYFIMAIVLASHCLVFGNVNQINTVTIGAVGEAVEGVPSDFKNDLWLNTNYMEMTVGENYSIVARRVPELSSLPNFNYEVISGASITVTDNGVITANSLGTSVVKVTYDAMTIGGDVYAACSNVNATYMVVDVIDQSVVTGIVFDTDFSLRSYDTYYFTEGTSRAYTFSLSAAEADDLAVYCNGVAAEQNGDDFTVLLENRANIIEIVAENTMGTKKLYYVADARLIEMEIANISNPSSDFEVGDEISINFNGITIPVYKLSGIYNPTFPSMWGGSYSKVKFDNNILGELETNDPNIGQYCIADHNQITLTLNESEVYEFTNGRIFEAWWGSELGTEKDLSGPGNPPLNAPAEEADFSNFPDFSIDLSSAYHYADFEDIALEESSVIFADASSAESGETVTETFTSYSYEFESFTTKYGATYFLNYGFAISNKNDNATVGGVTNMHNSAAGGGIDQTGNYAVVFDANSGGMGGQNDVKFSLAEEGTSRTITGCYVTNNTYAGNALESSFGGSESNDPDWCKITAEGFDAEGSSTGTLDFYLADFRNEDSDLDYILEDWVWFDLSTLGEVNHVKLSMSSSDVSPYGMNTPAYYCLDNIDKKRLELQNPLVDVNAFVTDANLSIDLSTMYFDSEIDDAVIVKTVQANTENSVVTANIDGDNLTLDFLTEGETNIIIKGQSAGMMLCDTFMVNVTTAYHYADFEDIALEASSVIFVDASSAGEFETISEVYTSHSYTFETFGSNWGSSVSNFGFSISNQTDNVNAGGADNMYNSEAGGDIDQDGNYAVVFDANSGGMPMGPQYDVKFSLAEEGASRIITGCYVTNNTYAGDVMEDGNGLGSEFGGADGTNPDWCKITAEGFNVEGTSTGTLDFYLADFRNEDSDLDYILEEWSWFDLTSLGEVNHVKLSMSSSDVSPYGMNTPAYYCLDNIDKKRLELQNPLADVTALASDENLIINLSEMYFDTEMTDAVIIKTVQANSENTVVTASITGGDLTLDFLAEGETTIIIKGKSAGMMLCDTFVVNVTNPTITGPYIANALEDIIVAEDADNSAISLTELAAVDGESSIVYSFVSNSDEALLSASLLEETLTLDYQENAFGSAMIIVQATANAITVVDTFMVEVTPVDDAPFVELAIEDKTLEMNADDMSIALSEVFADIDSELNFAINSNSNDQLVIADIYEDYLMLSFADAEYGTAILIVEANSNELSVTDTFEIEVAFNTGLIEINSTALQIYPNPCLNVLNVKSKDEVLALCLMNVRGQVILRNTFSQKMDVSAVNTGVYILEIETKSGTQRSRIIKN